MFCRKALFLAGLTLCVIGSGFSQVVTSAQNGYWHQSSTWEGGIVPRTGNCSLVRIMHAVQIESECTAPALDISGSLTIEPDGTMDIVPLIGGGEVHVSAEGSLTVNGVLVGRDSVQYSASPLTIRFGPGGRFRYLGASRGFIPIALWDSESVFEIRGFIGSGYIAIAFSESWKQHFGHVIYDCPQQTSFVDLNGYLRDMQGDFIVRNTNNQSLRLSTTQRPVITIGGNFRVEGPSEVWVSTTSDSARLHVGRNFEYVSTSVGPSYLTTRGRSYIHVGGKMHVDASGPLRLCSGSVDSTGVRKTTFVFYGGLEVVRGSFIAPSPGTGVMSFAGADYQEVSVPATAFSGNVHFYFSPESVVDVGESELRNTSGDLLVKGHLKLGSLHPMGALQDGNAGNFQIAGLRKYNDGCVLEYNGAGRQRIGNAHPASTVSLVIINNAAGVDATGDLVTGDLDVLRGELNMSGYSLTAYRDVLVYDDGTIAGTGTVEMTGELNSLLSLRGATIGALTISKAADAAVALTSPVAVTGTVEIRNTDVTLFSNGHLTLISKGDEPNSTAVVTALPSRSSIAGDVTVQRFMNGEGRLYRYLSSPVNDATVGSMMDDFPVTGTFSDPSTGPGINSAGPSLYYYDNGWKPFPETGYSHENFLQPGRGYAAFIRGGSQPVIWDVSGSLNQGRIMLPVTYYNTGDGMHDRWNLVGNPYACAVDWTKTGGWQRTGISEAIAVRDNGEGRFRYYDGEVGDLVNGVIAPGQAFWVNVVASDPVLTIDENAKAPSDAAFYRKANDVDYLVVTLRGNGFEDTAWLRKRRGAMPGFDRFDALKFPNDHLSFSFLTEDSLSLAINALDDMPCQIYVPLQMIFTQGGGGSPAPIPQGEYTVTVGNSGLFLNAQTSLIDHFTKDTIAASTYSFSVTAAHASAAFHRLGILIRTAPVKELGFSAFPVLCSDSIAVIRIKGEGAGETRYMAQMPSGEFYNDGNEITVPFGPAKHEPEMAVLYGQSLCSQVRLDSITLYRLADPDPPAAVHSSSCGPGVVTLAVQARPGYRYHWYEDQETKQYVATGPVFDSPLLSKSKTYHVLAEDESGCRSEPAAVTAIIYQSDSLDIRKVEGTLFSNHAETLWFYEDVLVHRGASLTPHRNGRYTAKVYAGACTMERTFFLPGTDVQVYPVPFIDFLMIISSGNDIRCIEIHDSIGRILSKVDVSGTELCLDTRHLKPGSFVVTVRTVSGTARLRVVKKK